MYVVVLKEDDEVFSSVFTDDNQLIDYLYDFLSRYEMDVLLEAKRACDLNVYIHKTIELQEYYREGICDIIKIETQDSAPKVTRYK